MSFNCRSNAVLAFASEKTMVLMIRTAWRKLTKRVCVPFPILIWDDNRLTDTIPFLVSEMKLFV